MPQLIGSGATLAVCREQRPDVDDPRMERTSVLTDLSIEAIGELSLVPPEASILNERAQAVTSDEIASSQFKALVARMLAIAAGETSQTAAARLVGLAAPQIGIAKRVILVDTGYQGVDREREPRRLEVFINPVIIRHSLETSTGREGCYSTGNVRGLVSRAASVVVEAIDGSGARVVTPAEGFVARVFQHEVDHLDGTRFAGRWRRHQRSDGRKQIGQDFASLRRSPRGDDDPPARPCDTGELPHGRRHVRRVEDAVDGGHCVEASFGEW
jgi:peptide deformylase